MNNDYGFELEDITPRYENETVFNETRENQSDLNTVITPMDALIQSVNKYRKIVPEFMEQATGMTFHMIKELIGGSAMFQDPYLVLKSDVYDEKKGWVLRAQYLSGNVRDKYEAALEAENCFPGEFRENITALKPMLDRYVPFDEIHVSLGSPWTPESVFIDFLKDLYHARGDEVQVHYMRSISKWEIRLSQRIKRSILNTHVYGLDKSMTAEKIIEKTMNGKAIKCYKAAYRDGKECRDVDAVMTKAALEKQELIIREFKSWICKVPPAVRDDIENAYNDTFKVIAPWSFDGSTLEFPDLRKNVILYPHQKKAIGRILLSGENTLLAHEVGAGKTFVFIVAVHELKRVGISERNLIVVPNNVLKSTIDTHKYLYPEDKILEIYPKDFTPSKRKEILQKIRNGHHTAVYMAYSSFNMLKVSNDYVVRQKMAEIRELRSMKPATRRERYLIERKIEKINKEIEKTNQNGESEDALFFEDLNIDTLVVDEAHSYKNITIDSFEHEYATFQTRGSRKCDDMLFKTTVVKKIIFATGTPVTNSLADIFVLQKYLQFDELKCRGIHTFDKWAKTFTEAESVMEVDVDGTSLRSRKRFSCFHNLPELMDIFSLCCDYYDSGNDRRGCPVFKGYTDITVEKTAVQDMCFKRLSVRAERIRRHRISKKVDNLLKVNVYGRHIALDPRFDPELDAAGRKIGACALEVIDTYLEYPGCSQVVFCDIGTPKEGFNVYDELKNIMISYGIPDHEIAYIHQATSESAKSRLFADVNKGKIRVIIGSTQKLGQGVNIQEKMICAHHLDIPWRPADMIQRDGRIWRQGNTCEEIMIKRYVTRGTYDAYSYQILEYKARVLSEFLAGTSTVRSIEDLADSVLSYGEIKALSLGNPLIKKRVELANTMQRLSLSSRQKQMELNELTDRFLQIPQQSNALSAQITAARNDYQVYKDVRKPMTKEERGLIGKEVWFVLRKCFYRDTPCSCGIYQGFEVVIPARVSPELPYVNIQSKAAGISYRVDLKDATPQGVCKRFDYALSHLEERADRLFDKKEELLTQGILMRKEIEAGNPYVEQIDTLREQIEMLDMEIEKMGGKDNGR